MGGTHTDVLKQIFGEWPENDAEKLSSARTLTGVKLRADLRSEGSYVNGSPFRGSGIACANGVIYVLERFDPGLVHDAIALAGANRKVN